MGYNKEIDAKHKEVLNDIKKNLAEVSSESNLLNREMFMALTLLQRGKLSGKFEYINEKNLYRWGY